MSRSVHLRIFLLIFLGATFRLNPAESQEIRLTLAATTDVHGAYFPNDWYSGKTLPGSLAHVSSWVRERRATAGEELILLDNGDLIQGDPASYYSNFIQTDQPNIAAQILNYLGYAAGSVGNHDLEAGHPVYDRLKNEFAFPWLSANSLKKGTSDPWFPPYTLLTKNGIRVAVLGLTTPKIPDWLPPALWSGLEFEDMIRSADRWTRHIREHEQPDLIVGLFHSGVDPTYGQQQADQPRNENAARLVAEKVPGIDVVFAGHDHRNWNLKVLNASGDSVLILGSESRATQIAVATVEFLKTSAGVRKIAVKGSHQDMDAYAPDPEFMSRFGGFIDSVRHYIDEPIGFLSRTITSEDAWFGPSEFVGLIHRAQLDLTGADLSFTAPLSFRATIPAGEMTVKDLFRLYKFENQLYTINLTGAEILGYLNYSYSLWMNTMTGPDDQLLNMSRQADGTWRLKNAYYNFDSAAGIEYTVDVSRPAGEMVTIQRMSDGRPFDRQATYTVALNSYRGSGGGGHLLRGAGLNSEQASARLLRSSDQDFRFLLSGWIRRQGTLQPTRDSNWKIVPEKWAQPASRRDAGRLFPRN